MCFKKFNKSKNKFEMSRLPQDCLKVKELNEQIERVYCLDGSLDMRYKENRNLVQPEFDFRETKNKLGILKY